MKRAVLLLIAGMILVMLAGCGGMDEYDGMPPLPRFDADADDVSAPEPDVQEPRRHDEPLFLSELSIPFDRAAELFAAAEAIFDEDGGALWGTHLGAAFMFFDPATNHAVANRPVRDDSFFEHDGLYVGVLPEEALGGAGGVTRFDATRWAMMRWTGTEDFEDVWILQQMVRMAVDLQPSVIFGLGGTSGAMYNPHLGELFARVSVQMEINALMEAYISGGGDAMMDALHDALAIRAERRGRIFNIGRTENSNEISSGMGIYTELVLARREKDLKIEWLEMFIDAAITNGGQSLAWSYSQVSGVLYALLLDEIGVEWREGVRATHGSATNLGELLASAIGITEPMAIGLVDLERYGYSEITAAEITWMENNERMTQEAFEAFDGVPVLRIDNTGNWGFYGEFEALWVPQLPTPAGGWSGQVFYGDFEYSGNFGTITFTQGRMLIGHPYHRVPAARMDTFGSTIIGYDWVLELSDDYAIEATDNGFRVVER
ncbi:MAG: hypothetical protein FWC93_01520 [Defluviitaleaceae bacterium]|nr:hypothetical protein [Defluviitaleaceae bacterium]